MYSDAWLWRRQIRRNSATVFLFFQNLKKNAFTLYFTYFPAHDAGELGTFILYVWYLQELTFLRSQPWSLLVATKLARPVEAAPIKSAY
jgi:hypothetical protein